jgi:hypothetical protein
MMPALALNRALSLVAIFAIAVLAGCSSSRPTPSGTAPSGRLSGTMNQWVRSVCNSPLADRHRLMPSATSGGQCVNTPDLAGSNPSLGRAEYVFGTYPSESAINNDLAMLGPYAEGNDGTEEVVFAVFMGENHSVLTPLTSFGFVLHPGRASACYGQYSHTRVECTQENVPSPGTFPPPAAAPAPSVTYPAPAAPPSRSNAIGIPADADRQGFVSYPGARCNYTNPAVVIARTADSALVICETGAGRFYYRGVGLQNGLSVEIDDPVQSGAGFVATNNGIQYSVSPGALLISQGSNVLSNEPMVEYWYA